MSLAKCAQAVLGLALGACASTTAPSPLAPLGVPVLGAAHGLELAVDTQGRAVAVVAIDQSVVVLEEREGAVVARGWPQGVDVHVDMADLSVGPSGAVAIAIRASVDGVSGDVLVARRGVDGAWIEPTRSEVSSYPPRAYEPRTAFDTDGRLLLVTNQGAVLRDGYGVAVSTAPSADAPFARPSSAEDVVSPALFYSNRPRPVLDARGDVLVTWYQSLGGALRVLYAERPGRDAAWIRGDEARALSPAGGPVDSSAPPDPATSPDGALAVAWGQEDGHGGVAVYLARRAPGRDFERPTSLDDRLSVGDGTCRDVVTRMTSDATIVVAWSQRAAATERVYVAVLPSESSRDEALVVAASSATLDASAPSLAVSPEGGVALAFVERSASGSAVVLRRGTIDALGDSEVLASDSALAISTPRVAIGGGRLVVGWLEAGRLRLSTTTLGR